MGVIIDEKLNFNDHIDKITKKAKNYTSSLSRILHYLNDTNSSILFNTFFYSCFSYCPLIWMCSTKTANNKINKIHKRALRLKCGVNNANFTELLAINEIQSIHIRNIRYLMSEMYLSLNKKNPKFMWNMFEKNPRNYLLRNNNLVKIPKPKTESFGYRSLKFRGPMLWNSLPPEIKSSDNIFILKKIIKQWNAPLCNCNLCRN